MSHPDLCSFPVSEVSLAEWHYMSIHSDHSIAEWLAARLEGVTAAQLMSYAKTAHLEAMELAGRDFTRCRECSSPSMGEVAAMRSEILSLKRERHALQLAVASRVDSLQKLSVLMYHDAGALIDRVDRGDHYSLGFEPGDKAQMLATLRKIRAGLA